ncbi:transposase family protein, partial [Salinarimonas soli]
MLDVVDEFTHECLAIRVARKLKAADMIDVLSDPFILRRVPGACGRLAGGRSSVRSDVGAKTTSIAPRSPGENGYVESFNARLLDELLGGNSFNSLPERLARNV